MKRKITVSSVQMRIEPNDIPANLKKAEKLVKKIFEKNKTELIVFPELCITGPIPHRLDLVQDENSNSIKFFRRLANTYKTHIVCGSFIKKVKKKYFNTSLLINNKGNIVLEYRKNNLWLSERKYLDYGEKMACVETPLGKIGIIICWDLTFPEASRRLARRGAEIICCPSYWTVDQTGILERHLSGNEKIFVNSICPARAIENEVLFIYANGAGVAKYSQQTEMWRGELIGQSQICAPILGTVAKIDDNSEGYITYTYDKQIAKDAEKIFKIRRDLGTRLKI
jgi:predicted amidohydrolase